MRKPPVDASYSETQGFTWTLKHVATPTGNEWLVPTPVGYVLGLTLEWLAEGEHSGPGTRFWLVHNGRVHIRTYLRKLRPQGVSRCAKRFAREVCARG